MCPEPEAAMLAHVTAPMTSDIVGRSTVDRPRADHGSRAVLHGGCELTTVG
jgi:hypothetical protein